MVKQLAISVLNFFKFGASSFCLHAFLLVCSVGIMIGAIAQAGDAILDTIVATKDRLDELESDIEWQNPELENGWTVYGAYQPFVYGKTKEGLVILSGMMSGCAKRGVPVFVLPDGYTPSMRQIFTVSAVQGGDYSIGQVYIYVDGRVIFYEAYQPWGKKTCDVLNQPSASWMSLSGVIFPSTDSLKTQ